MPVYFVLFLIGKKYPEKKDNASRAIVSWAFHVILLIAGTKIIVHGKENIPKDHAVLFVGNHRSYFDILSTYVVSGIKIGYVAKKEMEQIPLLSLWMKAIGCLFLDRENIKEGLKTILKGVDQLKGGHSIFIFPEGTRSKTEAMGTFKEGSTKMAEKAKCPIVPVALSNTDYIFEKNKHFAIKATTIEITFGDEIIINTLPKEDQKFLGAYLQRLIQQMKEKQEAAASS